MIKYCRVKLRYLEEFCVEYNVFPAEPDVGLMSDYIDGWKIISSSFGSDPALLQQFYIFIDFMDAEDEVIESCFRHHYGRD